MKKVGNMWVLDNESYFDKFFAVTGDKFDPEPVEHALMFISGQRTALDCGAHYGTVSRLIRDKFKRILAIEPNQETYECLLRNTLNFPNIECHQNAVGSEHRYVNVGLSEENTKYIGTEEEWIYCNSGCTQVLGDGDIEMITIDELSIDDLDFLKLDIEGMEYEALCGAVNTIRRCQPVVLLEDKGLGVRYGSGNDYCQKFLEKLGYVQVYAGKHGDYVYMCPLMA